MTNQADTAKEYLEDGLVIFKGRINIDADKNALCSKISDDLDHVSHKMIELANLWKNHPDILNNYKKLYENIEKIEENNLMQLENDSKQINQFVNDQYQQLTKTRMFKALEHLVITSNELDYL